MAESFPENVETADNSPNTKEEFRILVFSHHVDGRRLRQPLPLETFGARYFRNEHHNHPMEG